MGGILSYLQDILGGILSSSTKKSGGDSVLGGFCPTLECPTLFYSFKEYCAIVYKHKADYV